MLDAPMLDPRSAQQIFDNLEGQIARGGDPLAEALLHVFARYCELIIQRLNRVPEKSYAAFLETLNLSPISPLPARVPLTFGLVKKLPAADATIVVPAHTKVAAAPGPGESAPVVFETTREIALSDIRLEKIAVLDPHADLWADRTALASQEGGAGGFVFLGQAPVAHEFFIRHDGIFGRPGISELVIRLDIAGHVSAAAALDVEWRIPAPKGDIVLTPAQDSTRGLREGGEIVFMKVPEWPEYDLAGRRARWLACRLRQPLPIAQAAAGARGGPDHPTVQSAVISGRWQVKESPVTEAYSTAVPLDLTRDFYPFGEHPRFNDVFYVASDTFANPGTNVSLNVTLTNPASGPSNRSLPRVTKTGQPVIGWEYWDGRRWTEIGARDRTDALTENGQISFTIPASMTAVSVNGTAGHWIRAHLVAGNYGEPERIEFSDSGGYRRVPPTLAPPSIQTITVTSWLGEGPSIPDAIVAHNNFVLDDIERAGAFVPFQRAHEPHRALYLGFRAPDEGATDALWPQAVAALSQQLDRKEFDAWVRPIRFAERRGSEVRLVVPNEDVRKRILDEAAGRIEPAVRSAARADVRVDVAVENPVAERAIDLYCHMCAPAKGTAYLYDETRQTLPRLTWQYWNGTGWPEATVSDTTASLTVSGVITLRAGADALPWWQTTLGRDLYWMRGLWSAGDFGCMPEMTRLLPNTVMATQTLTLEDELLGSSNGKPHQVFRTARRPVLRDLHLQVREPDVPGPAELAMIRSAHGVDAVTVVADAQGNAASVWVRWHEAEDWLSSTHEDRHFVVNRETGEILFGDDIKGLIPPAGTNNVRLRRYQTGGGAAGNKPRGAIEQLRTTVPYVDRVSNLEAAVGGQDQEDRRAMGERGSRWLRHRERAVTTEDYEDLAKLASPLVARAKCYASEDRARDPLGRRVHRGMVSLVVVPRGSDARPQPDLELLRVVRDFLRERSAPEASLVVLAPEYVRVCVEADVVAESMYTEASTKRRCEEALSRFLHPVTGGEYGRGWEVGSSPHESDLYALLEVVQGLNYVRSLRLRVEEDRPGLVESRNFLISSGEHRIRLVA
jgi:hypothetical protein